MIGGARPAIRGLGAAVGHPRDDVVDLAPAGGNLTAVDSTGSGGMHDRLAELAREEAGISPMGYV